MSENLPALRGNGPTGFVPANLEEAMTLATTLSKSSLIPVALRQKPADVLIILMKGAELGLAPMQALSSISVISGKAVCEAALMVGLCVRQSDICEYFRLVESSPERAVYETKRKGSEPVSMGFTIAEAKAAKLTGKDNWTNYPAAMLRARASSALARAVYPDLCMGIYIPDEADAFDRGPRQVASGPTVRVIVPETVTEPEPEIPETVGATEPPALELTQEVAFEDDPAAVKEAIIKHCGGNVGRGFNLMKSLSEYPDPKTGEVKGAKSWKALDFPSYRDRVVAAMPNHEAECDGTCGGA